ncbi:MAG: LytTR family DNA-binding domain-containing protein [Clostridium sp.]|nr:LytTR family DNA-binding domain-containing protein [Acetatifactor muris]MCM1528013.1 LytTR family DNA-binding domain-containing protein [Bacteroides sp.]MCM1563098.1 LytTR family DNA-binding domain-containing protein [Clostridium sp.]
MFHIGICDDEKGTCAGLEDLLYEYGKRQGIKIDVNVWYTGESLCEFLQRENAMDLLFLDIELITTDGIAVGNFIREELEDPDTIIVYISSKSSYAMSLFRVQPLDFLIKPITGKMVEDIMDISMKIYEKKNWALDCYHKGCHYRVLYKDILYFYSQNKTIHIVTKKEELEFNGKLKDLAPKVPYNFIMIHQSYMVNLDFVAMCSYELMKMSDGTLLNISQPYRKTVRERIKQRQWENMK